MEQLSNIMKVIQSIDIQTSDEYVLHELKNTIRFRYVKLDKVRESYIIESTGDIYQPDLPLNLHKNTKHWIDLDMISSFDGFNYKKYPKHLRKQAKIAISNTHSSYVLYNEKLQLFGRKIGEDDDCEEIQKYVASVQSNPK